MSKQYPGGLIKGTPITPSNNPPAASGIWTISEHAYWQQLRSWTPIQAPVAIGAAYGGGYYAGQVNDSGTVYNLIIADATVGQIYGKKWGSYGEITNASSLVNGPANTAQLIVKDRGFLDYQAAVFCNDLVTGGYSDWYLPARNELEVCYYFLKPTTTANLPFSNYVYHGRNANAFYPEPVNTIYTSGTPAQTTATNFQAGAASQEFQADYYWSSSESTVTPLYVGLGQNFSTGIFYNDYNKTYTTYYTRAMRRVLAGYVLT